MSFIVYYGLHEAAAEEFPSAGAALHGLLDLERRGAKYVHAVDPNGKDVDVEELSRLAAEEGR